LYACQPILNVQEHTSGWLLAKPCIREKHLAKKEGWVFVGWLLAKPCIREKLLGKKVVSHSGIPLIGFEMSLQVYYAEYRGIITDLRQKVKFLVVLLHICKKTGIRGRGSG